MHKVRRILVQENSELKRKVYVLRKELSIARSDLRDLICKTEVHKREDNPPVVEYKASPCDHKAVFRPFQTPEEVPLGQVVKHKTLTDKGVLTYACEMRDGSNLFVVLVGNSRVTAAHLLESWEFEGGGECGIAEIAEKEIC